MSILQKEKMLEQEKQMIFEASLIPLPEEIDDEEKQMIFEASLIPLPEETDDEDVNACDLLSWEDILNLWFYHSYIKQTEADSGMSPAIPSTLGAAISPPK
jgi:hypothetical protein